MKQFTLSLMMISFVLTSAMAQNKVPTVVGQNTESSGAKIKVEEPVCNFGEIKEGTQAKATFKFTNTGDAPLIISDVARSCGCTGVTFPKEPIAPGEEGVISAVYDSRGRPGHFTKTLTIKHNAEGGNLYLTIKGTVIKLKEPKTPVKSIK